MTPDGTPPKPNHDSENCPSREGTLQSGDEFDLVDLCIAFWARRKLFAIAWVFACISGIAAFQVLYSPTRTATIRSVIELQPVSVGSPIILDQYAFVLAKRLSISDLVNLASRDEYVGVRMYLTESTINAIPKTNFIEIVTRVPGDPDKVSRASQFHALFSEAIVSEVKDAAGKFNQVSQTTFQSLHNGVMAVRGQVSYLEQVNQEQESLDLETAIDNIDAEIERLLQVVRSFEDRAMNLYPSVPVVASVTESGTGVSRSVAYVSIIILSTVLALFVVVIGSFATRVKQRLENRSQ